MGHHLTHRATESRASETGGYSQIRGGMDPTLKKLLFALLAILLSIVGTLVGMDRSRVDKTATTALEKANVNGNQLNLVKKDVEYIKDDVTHLKDGQKTIVKGMQEIINTLYTLPAERRRNPKPVLEAPPE